MKNRNIRLTILTLTVAAFLSSNVNVFAKTSQVDKTNGNSSSNQNSTNEKVNNTSEKEGKTNPKEDKTNQKEDKTNQKEDKTNQKEDKANQKSEKEINIISERLDNIEISLKSIQKNMNEYFENTTTSSAIDINNNNGTNTTTSSAIDINNDNETNTTTSSAIDINNNNGINTTTSSAIDINKDGEDLSDDFQNEYGQEDSGIYNSFYGKLNAINNRLNTVEKQINRISSSNNSDLTQLSDRVAKLKEQVKTSIDNLTEVQRNNVEKIKERSDRKKLQEQKISQDKKTWKIHFTKELKEETINSKNIMIIDSSNNIIDAIMSYDKKDKNVVIQINDGFNKGETYSILIGVGVQSIDGKNLPKPVEKKFTVN